MRQPNFTVMDYSLALIHFGNIPGGIFKSTILFGLLLKNGCPINFRDERTLVRRPTPPDSQNKNTAHPFSQLKGLFQAIRPNILQEAMRKRSRSPTSWPRSLSRCACWCARSYYAVCGVVADVVRAPRRAPTIAVRFFCLK